MDDATLSDAVALLREWRNRPTNELSIDLIVRTDDLIARVDALPPPNPNARLYVYDEIGEALSALLQTAGLTDECENPDDLLRETRENETVICHFDGGDAFHPAVVFARWETAQGERPDNPTLRVHLPPMPVNHELAVGEEGTHEAYLDSVWERPEAWRPLAHELRNPSVDAEPICMLDEE